MNDYAPPERPGRSTTRTMTGYHVGAVATAFLALMVVPSWRTMFVVGGLAGSGPGPLPVVQASGVPPAGHPRPRGRRSPRPASPAGARRPPPAVAAGRSRPPGDAPASGIWAASPTR